MSKYKQSYWVHIKCPFFHGDKGTSINCEGIKENSVLRQIFRTVSDRQDWEEKYCKSISFCKQCPVYKCADEKYI